MSLVCAVEIPSATDNLLENSDGVLHHCSLGVVACNHLFMLTVPLPLALVWRWRCCVSTLHSAFRARKIGNIVPNVPPPPSMLFGLCAAR